VKRESTRKWGRPAILQFGFPLPFLLSLSRIEGRPDVLYKLSQFVRMDAFRWSGSTDCTIAEAIVIRVGLLIT
jgi:hypothetical protein